MDLQEAVIGQTYTIRDIQTDDEDLKTFLFRLGCYSGEPITVISHLRGGWWFPSRTADTISTTVSRKQSLYSAYSAVFLRT